MSGPHVSIDPHLAVEIEIARHERWLDPDPLTLDYLAPAIVADMKLIQDERDERIASAWWVAGREDQLRATRPPRRVNRLGLVAIAAAAAALLIAGVAIGRASAAPRSGQTTAPQPGASGAIGSVDAPARVTASTSAALSGAPLVAAGLHATAPSGAPQPTDPPAIAGGLASWYAADGLVAAVPGWRFGDTPYRVRVTYGGRSVIVTVQDCLCGRSDRLIDLSDDAFRELAPLSRGVIPVILEDLAGPGATPPPTDTHG